MILDLVRMFSKKLGVTTPERSCITLVGYAGERSVWTRRRESSKLHRTFVEESRVVLNKPFTHAGDSGIFHVWTRTRPASQRGRPRVFPGRSFGIGLPNSGADI